MASNNPGDLFGEDDDEENSISDLLVIGLPEEDQKFDSDDPTFDEKVTNSHFADHAGELESTESNTHENPVLEKSNPKLVEDENDATNLSLVEPKTTNISSQNDEVKDTNSWTKVIDAFDDNDDSGKLIFIHISL